MRRALRAIVIIMSILMTLEIIYTIDTAALQITTENIEKDIVVDIRGNGDYLSIQEAIEAAEEGSSIYIRAGEYPEVIEIRKQITLMGEDKENTWINPCSEPNKYAIQLSSTGAKIISLSIKNSASGIYTSAVRITAPSTIIKECNFYDTPIGIAIWTSGNTIENCRFTGCTDEGIALLGTVYSECNNNVISKCVFQGNCDGIELQYSSGNTITGCDFYDNTHDGISAISEKNDQNTISNCRIYENSAHGVFFSDSSYNKIIDCEIYDNKDGNIAEFKNSANNEIISNSDAEEPEKESRAQTIISLLKNIRSNRSIIKIISILKSNSLLNF